MTMDKATLDRIEELQRNETLLYNCVEYLIDLWSINADINEMKENLKNIGFTDEDIKRLEIIFD